MRSSTEVGEFKADAQRQYVFKCKNSACMGTDPTCACFKRYRHAVAAYEACVPQAFWYTKPSDVERNKSVFKEVVQHYTKSLKRARRRGYGLLFLGDNGVGKSMFISYVLMAAIRENWTTYYTTMPQLDYDIKRGWKDKETEERLRWLLTSDFLAIDEMGKEKFKADPNSWMGTQIERILKQRFDDNMPVLLATNMDQETLAVTYGPTVDSILKGSFMPVLMEAGDFREKLHERMQKDMGYGQ